MAKRNRKIVNLEDIKDFKKYKSMMRPDLVEKDFIQSLAREGQRIIELAYATRGFDNRTGYLHDSYVSAVFKGKDYVEGTMRFLSKKEYGKHGDQSRARYSPVDAAKKFVESYKSKKTKGFTLVIAAAAWYSGVLEGREFRVISQVYSELEELKNFGVKGVNFVSHFDKKYFKDARIEYNRDFEITGVSGGRR